MRGTVLVLILCCTAVVARLHSEFLEVAGLLRSRARDLFPSAEDFIARAREYQNVAHDASTRSNENAHSMVVRLKDGCNHECIAALSKKFGEGATTLLNQHFLIIPASAKQLDELASTNPNLIKYYMAMVPEMKIDSEVVQLYKGDEQLSFNVVDQPFKSDRKVKLRILLNPLHEEEHRNLQSFISNYASAGDVTSHLSKYRPGHHRTLELTVLPGADLAATVRAFAARREVLWIEHIAPAVLHNRWANGVCDSGVAEESPLQTNSAANFTGLGEVVGVIDTGIDMQNCYFWDPNVDPPYVWSDESSASTVNHAHRKVVQYYMYRTSNDATDTLEDNEGHGTHVSGIVGGRPPGLINYGDLAKYSGMSSEAKLAFFDIGQTNQPHHDNSTLLIPADLNTDLFSVMYESGARIFTNSWGRASNLYDTDAVNVDKFMWENKDALVLFSAGNSGENGPHSTVTPSTNKNGVCVGASLNDHNSWLSYEGDEDTRYGIEAMAGFSSQGPTTDSRLKPDVVAPGSWTTSAGGYFNTTEPFCGIRALQGTSMACPTVAGFAVKIRQYFMGGFYPSGTRTEDDAFTPSGALLKAMLIHSGQPMKYFVEKNTHALSDISATYPSNIQGYGRIDMSAVLHFGEATTSPINLFVIGAATSSDPHYAEFAAPTSHTYTFSTTSDTHPLRVTLSYTDVQGSALNSGHTSGQALRNILSLSLSSSQGASFTPYLTAGVVQDNTQMIDVPNPTTDTTYTVTVTCSTLLVGPQPYALVVTGRTTYVENVDTVYSVPADNFTATGGALKYILALGFLTLVLAALVLFFRRVSKKKTSMMLDPSEFEATDDFYEQEVQDTGRGGRKSVFATIRNIRSNHRKAAERRQLEAEQRQFGGDVEGAGYYQ